MGCLVSTAPTIAVLAMPRPAVLKGTTHRTDKEMLEDSVELHKGHENTHKPMMGIKTKANAKAGRKDDNCKNTNLVKATGKSQHWKGAVCTRHCR